jgi:hypothetical protein
MSVFKVLKYFATTIIALACVLVAAYTVFVFLPPMLTGGTVASITGLVVAALSLIPVLVAGTLLSRRFIKKE